jgi:hypothetical protein
MEVTRGEVRTVRRMLSSGLLGLCGVWHCHDEAVPLLPVALDVFCELHLETSIELLHSAIHSSHFHHASEKANIGQNES